MSAASADVLIMVDLERTEQDLRWGEQNYPDGTGLPYSRWAAEHAKTSCEIAVYRGEVTWRHILHEEVLEAFAESDPARLRRELIQVAAVAVAWVEAIDRRDSNEVAR